MNSAYVLVQSTIGHEMEVLSELLKIQVSGMRTTTRQNRKKEPSYLVSNMVVDSD